MGFTLLRLFIYISLLLKIVIIYSFDCCIGSCKDVVVSVCPSVGQSVSQPVIDQSVIHFVIIQSVGSASQSRSVSQPGSRSVSQLSRSAKLIVYEVRLALSIMHCLSFFRIGSLPPNAEEETSHGGNSTSDDVSIFALHSTRKLGLICNLTHLPLFIIISFEDARKRWPLL